jgi:hypothetical protein
MLNTPELTMIHNTSLILARFAVAMLFSVFLALPGCGGGGGDDGGLIGSTEGATGAWQGTITVAGRGTFAVLGVLNGGEMFLVSNNADIALAGDYRVNGTSVNGNGNIYPVNGAKLGTFSLSGVVATASTLSGNFSASNGTSGTFNLTYDSISDRGSSLSTTDGNWSVTDGTYTLTVSIDSTGLITGSDTDGCVYNGNGSIIDPAVNIYRVNITLSSCGLANDTYSGYAVVSDDMSLNDTLTFSANNANGLLFGSLLRQ